MGEKRQKKPNSVSVVRQQKKEKEKGERWERDPKDSRCRKVPAVTDSETDLEAASVCMALLK